MHHVFTSHPITSKNSYWISLKHWNVSLTTSWENSGFFMNNGLFDDVAAERTRLASAVAPDIVNIKTWCARKHIYSRDKKKVKHSLCIMHSPSNFGTSGCLWSLFVNITAAPFQCHSEKKKKNYWCFNNPYIFWVQKQETNLSKCKCHSEAVSMSGDDPSFGLTFLDETSADPVGLRCILHRQTHQFTVSDRNTLHLW